MENQFWKRCNSCKSEIPFGANYFVCSISTCNQKPFNYVFCSVSCFERHLPGARHKDAAAIGEKAPSFQAPSPLAPSTGAPTRRILSSAPPSTTTSIPRDILIVVSKLKDFVKLKSEMNTSGDVAEILSDIVRRECEKAIENAKRDGRKTLMARDFK